MSSHHEVPSGAMASLVMMSEACARKSWFETSEEGRGLRDKTMKSGRLRYAPVGVTCIVRILN